MKKILIVGFGAAALGLAASVAFGQSPTPIYTPPKVTVINQNDLFQDVVNGYPQAPNYYASAALLGTYFGNSQPSRGNALVGGDATTNLFQRSTAGAQTTSTTPSYNGPDRWGQWATASAGVTVSRDSTAGDLISGYKYAIKLAHTNTTAGTICMAQEVESVNSYQFAGATAELDFHAVTGAGFTGTGGAMTASIVTGAGQDEGLASLEAGTWTSQANSTAAVTVLGVGTSGRYAAFASIPAGTTEIAVTFCYATTTADTNDYIAFSGIQLVRNSFGLSWVNATTGYNIASTPGLLATSFERRPQAVETLLQQRYYWQLAETAAVRPFLGQVLTTSTANVHVFWPGTMRAAPTMAYTAGGWSVGIAAGTSGANQVCATLASVASTITVQGVDVLCTATSGIVAGNATELIGTLTTGLITASAEL